MIELILNLISAGLLAAGSIFVIIGAFGLIRLPDFYTRLHAAGITDTLGASVCVRAGEAALARCCPESD